MSTLSSDAHVASGTTVVGGDRDDVGLARMEWLAEAESRCFAFAERKEWAQVLAIFDDFANRLAANRRDAVIGWLLFELWALHENSNYRERIPRTPFRFLAVLVHAAREVGRQRLSVAIVEEVLHRVWVEQDEWAELLPAAGDAPCFDDLVFDGVLAAAELGETDVASSLGSAHAGALQGVGEFLRSSTFTRRANAAANRVHRLSAGEKAIADYLGVAPSAARVDDRHVVLIGAKRGAGLAVRFANGRVIASSHLRPILFTLASAFARESGSVATFKHSDLRDVVPAWARLRSTPKDRGLVVRTFNALRKCLVEAGFASSDLSYTTKRDTYSLNMTRMGLTVRANR
ncbi:MAG: hypothetical protein JNL94_15320 [Planctomycetes bacterium]|jgi:hypothetical protein|nr:hypothetical protein [Planctomycetota bacterium]